MTTDSKSDALWHLADALSEDILNTPAEDLLAEEVAETSAVLQVLFFQTTVLTLF